MLFHSGPVLRMPRNQRFANQNWKSTVEQALCLLYCQQKENDTFRPRRWRVLQKGNRRNYTVAWELCLCMCVKMNSFGSVSVVATCIHHVCLLYKWTSPMLASPKRFWNLDWNQSASTVPSSDLERVLSYSIFTAAFPVHMLNQNKYLRNLVLWHNCAMDQTVLRGP